MQKHTHLPLAGVRVIDFGQQIAGPAVAMVLADLGATVIHIDPPQGPQWKSPANAILNRNKSCLRLDLKSAEGLTQAHNLIDSADILIESFRPGVIQKLGIDFQLLCSQRPELICFISVTRVSMVLDSILVPSIASNRLRSSSPCLASGSEVFLRTLETHSSI